MRYDLAAVGVADQQDGAIEVGADPGGHRDNVAGELDPRSWRVCGLTCARKLHQVDGTASGQHFVCRLEVFRHRQARYEHDVGPRAEAARTAHCVYGDERAKVFGRGAFGHQTTAPLCPTAS
jgi:hypothetical protein